MSELLGFPAGEPKHRSGNGGGNGSDGRLRAVEAQLARIEERLKHMPTKAQLLLWLVGPLAAAVVTLGIALIRALGQ